MRTPLILGFRLCVLLAVLAGMAPAAADEDVPLTVSTRTSRATLQVRVAPHEGHHLAGDFPARLDLRTIPETGLDDAIDLAGRVSDLLEGIEVELPSERPIVVDGELEVGLCDDGGTCRPHTVGFQVAVERRAQAAFAPVELMAIQPILGDRGTAPQLALAVGPGATWLKDDLDAALAQAERRGVPVVMVFKTRWCPPCNQLWSEVLTDPEHQADLEPYVRAWFDADLPASWDAKIRYQVGGYPTTVVCTASGEVLGRIEGYEEPVAWLAAVREAAAGAETLDAMVARAHETAHPQTGDHDPQLALAIAWRYTQLKDGAGAAEWLDAVPAGAAAAPEVRARVVAFVALEVMEPAAGAAALEQVLLDQALQPVVPSLQQLWWWTDVADLRSAANDAEGSALAWQRAVATAEHVLSEQPELAAEAWYAMALAAGARGDSAAEIEAWSSAADRYLELVGGAVDVDALAAQRGNVLSAAGCLRRAGRIEEVMSLLDPAIDAAPDAPSLYHSRSRAAAAGEGFEGLALADAGTAWRLAEGDLRLKVADTWSALLVELERPGEARRVLEQTLEGRVLPEDASVRTHRYEQVLRTRLAELPTEEAQPEQ